MNVKRAWLLASALTLAFPAVAWAAGISLVQGIGTALGNSTDVRLAEIAVIEAERNLQRVSVEQLRKNIQMAEDNLTLARLGAASAKDELASRVEQAYFAAKVAEEVISLREASLANAQKQLEAGKVKFKAGLSGKSDLTALEDNVVSARYSLEAAKRNRKLAYLRFNKALGNDPDAQVVLNDKLTFAPVKPDLKEALGFALGNRRDILQARQNLARKQDDLRLATNEFTPVADQEQLKYEVEKAQIAVDNIVRDIRINVEEAYSRLLDCQNEHDLKTRAMNRAKSALDSTGTKYKRGLASTSDLVNAVANHENSQLQKLQSVNDYRNALSAFYRAIGKPHPALAK